MTVLAAGVDTWSPAWYVPIEGRVARAMDDAVATRSGRAGWLADPVLGHRVGLFGGVGRRLLAAEGHPDERGLAAPDDMGPLVEKLRQAIGERIGEELPVEPVRFDHSVEGFAGVRRADFTVDYGPESGARGLALLAGIAAVDPAGVMDSRTIRRGGRVETVAWQGRRGLLSRVYDKGVESRLARPGELVRFEDQRRWREQSTRRAPEELDAAYVRDTFNKRFLPLYRASRGVRVVTSSQLLVELKRAIERGEISPGQAVDAIGQLTFERAGLVVGSRMTRYRHRRVLQDLGLVPTESGWEEALVDVTEELDLHNELEEVMDTGEWFTPAAKRFVEQREAEDAAQTA